MNLWIAGINQTAVVALAALLNTLWYAAAVVGLTWLAFRYLRRVNAATRYWIWTAQLGFLVLLPFLPGLVSQLKATWAGPATAAPMATVPAGPQVVHQHLAPVTITLGSASGPNHWPLYLLALWIVIAAWQLGLLLRGVVSVKRMKAHAQPGPAVGLPVQLRRKLEVLASDEINSPVAVGYIHPAVILPIGLPASLEEGEMQDVLLHELAHLARYDDWLNLVTRGLGVLLVLHPLAAIVLRQIEREREMACDDFVVATTGSVQGYARSLARLHDLHSKTGTRLLTSALLGRKVSLPDRIESLLRRGRKYSARPSMANLGLGALLLTVLLGAGGLVPGWLAIVQAKVDRLPSFEEISIRPAPPGAKGGSTSDLSKYAVTAVTAKYLIEYAYNDFKAGAILRDDQLVGDPAWIKTDKWVVNAKVNDSTAEKLRKMPREESGKEKALMVRSMLADRFKLRIHHEARIHAVYALVVSKGGPRFLHTRFPDADIDAGHLKGPGGKPLPPVTPGMRRFWLHGPTAHLAELLSRIPDVRRLVLDQTGIQGNFDFVFEWKPELDSRSILARPGNSSPGTSAAGPSIFTALREQLGLTLKPEKVPVDVVVIDHIEPPTPN